MAEGQWGGLGRLASRRVGMGLREARWPDLCLCWSWLPSDSAPCSPSRDPYNYIGPTWKIQGNRFISRSFPYSHLQSPLLHVGLLSHSFQGLGWGPAGRGTFSVYQKPIGQRPVTCLHLAPRGLGTALLLGVMFRQPGS